MNVGSIYHAIKKNRIEIHFYKNVVGISGLSCHGEKEQIKSLKKLIRCGVGLRF
jgi:hypothetical protein